MKRLSAALVLIALTLTAQIAAARNKPPVDKPSLAAQRSITINGIAAQDASSSGSSVATTITETSSEAARPSSSSSSSAPPQPLDDQKIKTKSNIKND